MTEFVRLVCEGHGVVGNINVRHSTPLVRANTSQILFVQTFTPETWKARCSYVFVESITDVYDETTNTYTFVTFEKINFKRDFYRKAEENLWFGVHKDDIKKLKL